MHSALHSMCLQSEINISDTSMIHVVLVQYIIQALIEVLQVKKDDRPACLHAYFDLVDVSTDLNTKTTNNDQTKQNSNNLMTKMVN